MRPNPRALPAILTLALLAPTLAAASPIEFQAKGAEPGSAVLELATEYPVTMTPIPFRLLIREANGRPITGAQVSCEMTMPAMKMPENRPRVKAREDHYGGELMFTCAQGAWRISCEVARTGHPRQTLVFDIDRVRMR